jgi:hypothetical protein
MTKKEFNVPLSEPLFYESITPETADLLTQLSDEVSPRKIFHLLVLHTIIMF